MQRSLHGEPASAPGDGEVLAWGQRRCFAKVPFAAGTPEQRAQSPQQWEAEDGVGMNLGSEQAPHGTILCSHMTNTTPVALSRLSPPSHGFSGTVTSPSSVGCRCPCGSSTHSQHFPRNHLPDLLLSE